METKTRISPGAPEAATGEPRTEHGTAARQEAQQAVKELTEGSKSALRKARQEVQERLTNGEEFVRDHPTQSAITAVGAGFVIAQLPLRYIVAALINLAVFVLRPVILIYGFFKLVENMAATQGETQQKRAQTPSK